MYLVAKKFKGIGSLAVKTEPGPGKTSANLAAYLTAKTIDKGIQIAAVSDLDIFGEYKPYEIIPSEKEFITKVLEME